VLTATEGYRRQLSESLVLRSIASREDLERVADLNGAIHGDGVAAMTRELVLHHPHTRPEHWLFVEDTEADRVVSTLCLIPWTWRYEGIELKAGEVGLVATLEPYRRRGLVREQFARHAQLLREGNYDLSHIQGIPYFYRQFGYEYAVPLEGGWRLELHAVPDAPDPEEAPYRFRQASLDDLQSLMRLYEEAAGDLDIHTAREEATWRYLLGPSLRTEMVAETWLVLDKEAAIVGYLRVPAHGFGEGLIVNEVSRLSASSAEAVLGQLKKLALERGKPFIRLCLPTDSVLVQTARYRDAHDLGTYAWQIRLVDVSQLLWRLAPAFERRLATSPVAGLSETVCLNLYREAFELRFEGGRLLAVTPLGFCDRGGIRIPPTLVVPLLLGYKSREELAEAYPDLSIRREYRHLVDVLFPKLRAYIYTIY
jgi:hypothetical protein